MILQDSDALEGIVYSFINTLLGKETSSVPGADPCHLSLDDVMFVFYCFNEEWEMADIMRRYEDPNNCYFVWYWKRFPLNYQYGSLLSY